MTRRKRQQQRPRRHRGQLVLTAAVSGLVGVAAGAGLLLAYARHTRSTGDGEG